MTKASFSTTWPNSRSAFLSYAAFSLVEVVLALGIATFAVLVIVALLPMGVRSTKDSLEETGAINVMSQVIADRQATPSGQPSTAYQLPALTNTMTTPVTVVSGSPREINIRPSWNRPVTGLTVSSPLQPADVLIRTGLGSG